MSHGSTSLALIGFQGTALASLELFFNRFGKQYALVSAEQADAILYNADQPEQLDEQKENYHNRYNKPGIVVSTPELSWKGMITLRKPYTTSALSQALQQLDNQLLNQDSNNPLAASTGSASLEQVVKQYRDRVQHAYTERQQAAQLYQDQNSKRKIFQEQLLARKRSAEITLKDLKAGGLAERLAKEKPSPLLTQGGVLDITRATVDEVQQNKSAGSLSAEMDYDIEPASPHAVHDCCGHSPNLNLRVPGQRRRIFFNPEGQLLSLTLQAIERGRSEGGPVAVIGLPKHHLVYFPNEDRFYANVDEEFLVQMAHVRFRFGELHLQLVGLEELAQLRDDPECQTLSPELLIWRIACWSSRGRLIAGVDPDALYKLDSLPPANVLIGLPYTRQILETWSREPLSVQDLAKRLGAAQRYVFPVASAAWVLGLLSKSAQ